MCRSIVVVHGGTLDDGAFRGEVSEEDGETARRMVGVLQRADHLGIEHLPLRQVFADRLSRDGHGVRMDQAAAGELLHQGGDAACLVEIVEVVGAARRHEAEVRGLVAECVEGLEGERMPASLAMAGRWSEVLVDPPKAMIHA